MSIAPTILELVAFIYSAWNYIPSMVEPRGVWEENIVNV